MPDVTLYSWSISRSGPTMTITHSCGKLTGFTVVGVEDGAVVAYRETGVVYRLHVG